MANSAQVNSMPGADYSIWRVIMASSVGTMIEWYDFYIFDSLAAILGPKFYPPGNDTFASVAISDSAVYVGGHQRRDQWRRSRPRA